MKISVFGCGYLGAVHAAAMAHLGHDVVGIDVVAEQVASLSAGRSPFFEPGLDDLLAAGLASGRLSFTTDPAEAAEGADLVPKVAKKRKVRAALNNSFGFGGTNASLIVKALD